MQTSTSSTLEETVFPPVPETLSDVPRGRLEEVQAALDELRIGVPGGGAGGIGDLRHWLHTLNHITGFSREVTVQLCRVIERCLVSSRSSGQGNLSSGDLQQTFVRMGGVRSIVDALMARRQDAYVVTACLGVLSSICQGSPVAAESVQAEGHIVRLLLRTIELHAKDDEVVEAGCLFIGHLCAPLQSSASGSASALATRCQAHRKCQVALVDAGVLDLLIAILSDRLARIARMANQAEELQARVARSGRDMLKKDTDVKGKVQRVKASMAVRQAWEAYHAEEAAVSHTQEMALHALILVATDNEYTVRMLAGALWCWRGRQKLEIEVMPPQSEDSGSRPPSQGSPRSRTSRTSSTTSATLSAKPKSKSSRTGSKSSRAASSKTNQSNNRRQSTEESASHASVAEMVTVNLDGDTRQSSTTLEGFAGTLVMVVDVLRGPLTRDRPGLATRACQLLSLLARHQKRLLERLLAQSGARTRQLEVKLRLPAGEAEATASEQGRRQGQSQGQGQQGQGQRQGQLEAPFAPLEPLLAALTAAMRSHLQDAPLLVAALESLVPLREVALMSTPADVSPNGAEAKSNWQRLLAQVGEAGEFAAAAQVLQRALHSTEVAEQRMGGFQLQPGDLAGEGICLTPRMKEAALACMDHATRLASEVVSAAWQKGEPTRLSRKPTSRSLTSQGGPRSWGSPSSPKRAGKGKGMGKGKAEEGPAVEKKSWQRALGYFEHDEADFDRVWKAPLTEALSRSFSCPEVSAPGDPAEGSDALDQFLQVHLLQSAPGKLRARCVLQPKNKVHQKVSEQRVRMGSVEVVPEVTSALAKSMRKGGYMLPKYGLQVSVRKGRKESLLEQATEQAEQAG